MARQAVNIDVKGRNKTTGAFNAAERGLTNLSKKAGAVTAALASVTAVAGSFRFLSSAIQDSIDRLDRLGKAARRANVSVEELQALRLFGELGGIDSRQLEKSLEQLAIRAGEAAMGMATYRDAFEALDVQIEQSNGALRSPLMIFKDTIAALAGIDDETRRASLAYRTLGRRGAALAQVFFDQGLTVDQVVEKFTEMGVIIGDDVVQAGEQAKDEFTLLGKAIDNLLDTSLSPFIERLGETAKGIREVIGETANWIQLNRDASEVVGIDENLAERLAGRSVAELRGFLAIYEAELAEIPQSVRDIAESPFHQAAQELPEVAEAVKNYLDLLRKISTVQQAIAMTGRGIADASPDEEEAAESESEAMKRAREILKNKRMQYEVQQALNDLVAELPLDEQRRLGFLKDQTAELEKQARMNRSTRGGLYSSRASDDDLPASVRGERRAVQMESAIIDELSAYQDELLALNSLWERGVISAEKFREASAEVGMAMRRLTDVVAEADDSDVFQNFGDAVRNNLRDALISGNFDDLGDALVVSLKAALIDAVLEDLDLGNVLSTVFGAIFGGQKQHGGLVGANSAYLVGERGPEIFVPSFDGTVIPNNRLQSLGRGSVSITNNNVFNGDVRSDEDLLLLAEVVQNSTVATIEDQLNRGRL